jgi:hypothetical protein
MYKTIKERYPEYDVELYVTDRHYIWVINKDGFKRLGSYYKVFKERKDLFDIHGVMDKSELKQTAKRVYLVFEAWLPIYRFPIVVKFDTKNNITDVLLPTVSSGSGHKSYAKISKKSFVKKIKEVFKIPF